MIRHLRRLRWSAKARGWLAALALGCAKLTRLTHWSWHWQYLQRQFDAHNGVKTSDVIPIESLDTGTHDDQLSWGYFPTSPETFLELLAGLKIDYREFTFIDFGSGMGRALLLASLFPFRRVIGVEFCELLHRQANANVRSFKNRQRRCDVIQTVCEDATSFQLPPGDLVLYFFNPFREELLARALANVQQSLNENGGRVIVVYCRPIHHELLDSSPDWDCVSFVAGRDEPRSAVYHSVASLASADSCDSTKDLVPG